MVISGYFVMGWFSLFAGFLAYFAVLHDFGVKYSDVRGILGKRIFVPFAGDEYDPSSPWIGNSLLKGLYPCEHGRNYEDFTVFADLQFNVHSSFDLRVAYATCNQEVRRAGLSIQCPPPPPNRGVSPLEPLGVGLPLTLFDDG